MHQTAGQFFIRAQDHAAALTALREERARKRFPYGSDRRWDTLKEALVDLGWWPTINDDGHIGRLHFQADSAGDDARLFATLAPYVAKGSFLEMQGEDGETWRWVFDGQSCRQVKPSITWPE
jgi:hypothetical protein